MSPEVPQLGMPAGEPYLMKVFRISVPRSSVMSGVSGLPVAPLRNTPWQPAQRSKKICVASWYSTLLIGGASGLMTISTPCEPANDGAPWKFSMPRDVPGCISPWDLSLVTSRALRCAPTSAAVIDLPEFSQLEYT